MLSHCKIVAGLCYCPCIFLNSLSAGVVCGVLHPENLLSGQVYNSIQLLMQNLVKVIHMVDCFQMMTRLIYDQQNLVRLGKDIPPPLDIGLL